MDEYITKQQAINACNDGYAACVQDCVDNIKSLPAINMQKAVKGKWTLNRDGSGTCSICGRTQNNCWDFDNWDNFCHFCGADMRG